MFFRNLRIGLSIVAIGLVIWGFLLIALIVAGLIVILWALDRIKNRESKQKHSKIH